MSSTDTMRLGSAFVPHDLERPVAGVPGGPLAGLTVAVKDMYDVAGTRTGGGSPEWLAEQQPATANATAVARLLEAGATIIGKTVCDEFFYSVSGANAHYGTPVNPRAHGGLPGGSSSGSAAATAAGLCDAALGSDTGGSIRIPAAHCGLFGLRPTHGRVDLTGVMGMAPSFDTGGWFASSAGVFRRVGAVLLDEARTRAPISRLIVLDDQFEHADAKTAALVRAVLDAAAAALPPAQHDRAAGDAIDTWREAFRTVQAYETWRTYGAFMERVRPNLGPGIKERFAYASTVTAEAAEAGRRVQANARARMHALAAPGTILAMPTAPDVAPPVDFGGEALEQFRIRVMRLCCPAGLSGLPQVSIPAGIVNGRPVGLSFIGWQGGDEALLDLAVSLAKYCGASIG